jgi:Autotransporter beta-domain
MKAFVLLLVPVCGAALSAVAFADEPPATIQLSPQQPAAPPRPMIDVSTPALAPPVPRTYHVHDGFYLRASVGFGDYHASFSDANSPNRDFDNHGSDLALDLLIGGSPSPGVAVGGAILVDPTLSTDGGVSTLIGPFVDGFPNRSGGWHLGGLIGFASQSFQNVNANSKQRTAGFGGAAWFGYDFWVAGDWAIGPQLRLMGARTSDTKSDENISAFARSFTIGMSVVFN